MTSPTSSSVVVHAGPAAGSVSAPGSKSHTNRALVLAALATGESTLEGALVADDVDAMRAGIGDLGVAVDHDAARIRVVGGAGRFSCDDVTVHARMAGTALRFLTAAATLASGTVTVTGDPALLRRPIGPLVAALNALGCDVDAAHGLPPVRIRPGRPRGGRVVVDATMSSQFVTALLLIAPFASDDVEVHSPGLGAAGYVHMTIDLMRRWGAQIEATDDALFVRASAGYHARQEMIAGDASAAVHLAALAAATRGTVTVANLGHAASQPDLGSLDALAAMGCRVGWDSPDAVTVTGPEKLDPIDLDLRGMPDQLPTFAALAALAPGRSLLRGIEVTRHHETDRVAAVATELAKLGIDTATSRDSIEVHGGSPRPGVAIDTYGDHRMAMAFAALAARVGDTTIADPGCVAKTYPSFWADAAELGLRMTPRAR